MIDLLFERKRLPRKRKRLSLTKKAVSFLNDAKAQRRVFSGILGISPKNKLRVMPISAKTLSKNTKTLAKIIIVFTRSKMQCF
jgi:hypothetical protein